MSIFSIPSQCRGHFINFCGTSPIAIIPQQKISNKFIVIADALGRWGFVDDGKVVIPVQYDQTIEVLVKYAGVKVNPNFVFVDQLNCLYPVLSSAKNDKTGVFLIANRFCDGWAFRTSCGDLITHFHDFQSYFHEGLALIETTKGWAYINLNGQISFRSGTSQAGSFKCDRAMLFANGLCGFVDRNGTQIIPPIYNHAWGFNEGLAAVNFSGRWGYIDPTGKNIISFKYKDARPFSEGMARVSDESGLHFTKKDGVVVFFSVAKFGFINNSGKHIIPKIFDNARDFSEGLAAVKTGNKWGYVTLSGTIEIPPIFEDAASFSGGLARVRLNNAYGFIAANGKMMIKSQYLDAFDFSEGLAAVKTFSGWGFIDKSGKWVIEPFFTDVSPFREGLARAGRLGEYGYIDRNGDWAVSPRFEDATTFSEGLAYVRLGNKRLYIQHEGSIAFEVP